MDTAANRPLNALRRFFDAYLVERDADKALRCVAPSFHWIGTGAFERTVGRAELRKLMEEDVRNEPEPYVYTFNALHTPDDVPFVGGDAIFTKRLPDGQSLSLETRCSEKALDELSRQSRKTRSTCPRTACPAGSSAAILKRGSRSTS